MPQFNDQISWGRTSQGLNCTFISVRSSINLGVFTVPLGACRMSELHYPGAPYAVKFGQQLQKGCWESR